LIIVLDGHGVDQLSNEAGGHRIQRVPKSERNGRVHSSTVTVSVLSDQGTGSGIYDQRADDDFEISWYSGSGAGGQHRNKHQNSARIMHRPTGLVRQAQTRSRENSYQTAMAALHAELDKQAGEIAGQAENAVRRSQVGSGERSDRRRTYQFQNGLVTDHKTGHRAPVDRVMAGRFDLLWR
jgi:peptide chain release factor 1